MDKGDTRRRAALEKSQLCVCHPVLWPSIKICGMEEGRMIKLMKIDD